MSCFAVTRIVRGSGCLRAKVASASEAGRNLPSPARRCSRTCPVRLRHLSLPRHAGSQSIRHAAPIHSGLRWRRPLRPLRWLVSHPTSLRRKRGACMPCRRALPGQSDCIQRMDRRLTDPICHACRFGPGSPHLRNAQALPDAGAHAKASVRMGKFVIVILITGWHYGSRNGRVRFPGVSPRARSGMRDLRAFRGDRKVLLAMTSMGIGPAVAPGSREPACGHGIHSAWDASAPGRTSAAMAIALALAHA